ncbi:hypothetical protein [Escherichia phage M01]|nr:hypothetical protein [Escherichia phage M01]
MNIMRRLLCTHKYLTVRVAYGDEIIGRNYKRYCQECTKCGAIRYVGGDKC